MDLIKVGYCVAYDWYLLEHSIPQIYKEADLICLSIDKDRQSWSGKPFSWDQAGFDAMISRLDPDKKIKLYEENFYLPNLQPMQNEVRQRNMIAAFMGKGGWHIQLDADEYFLDFKAFVSYLQNFKSTRKVNISCPWINLYRQVDKGFLWIKPNHFKQVDYIQVATKYPEYEYGRRNGNFNILTNFGIIHQSWARNQEEIWEKLNNWGHSRDFDVEKHFQIWNSANLSNYKEYQNFHHLKPEAWPALDFIEGSTIGDLINMKGKLNLPISKIDLAISNSIWISRIKKILNGFKP